MLLYYSKLSVEIFFLDDTLFITVKSTLMNNGTFWCRVWDKQQDFDDRNLERLSTELRWFDFQWLNFLTIYMLSD